MRPEQTDDTGTLFDAAVIGAGFAGLSAAETLKESPLIRDVLLLEGRGKEGGRASDGPSGARGAELVYSQRVADLAKRHGLTVEELADEWEGSYFFAEDGSFGKTDRMEFFNGAHVNDVLQAIKDEITMFDRNISVETFLSLGKSKTFSRLTQDEQAFIRRLIEGEYAAALGEIGIRSLQSSNGDTFHADMVGRIPDGGYGRLAQAMALELRRSGVRQRCSALVQDIVKLGDHYQIRTGRETFVSRSVVVTAPISVLQDEKIKLPGGVPESLGNLGRGKSCKVLCTFPKPLWPDDFNFAYSMRPPFCYAWPRSEGGSHTLTLYISGRDAEDFTKTMNQPGGRQKALEVLRKEVGNMLPEAGAAIRHENTSLAAWPLMPQSGMSYAYNKPDGTRKSTSVPKNFAETNDCRVVLAGEAYANSTVDGALQSGQEAAMHIRKLFAWDAVK